MNPFFYSLSTILENNNNSSNAEEINNSVSSSNSYKKLWCYSCKKQFSLICNESDDPSCIFCGKTFCEIIQNDDITSESHPMHFKPYICKENNTNNNNNNSNDNRNTNTNSNSNINVNSENNDNGNNVINYTRNINGVIFNLNVINASSPFPFFPFRNNSMFGDDNIDNIINEIMMHDTNKYGNPPASKKAVEKLKKCKISEEIFKNFGIENSCAVCKEVFIIGEECLLMPCEHHFHNDCLLPWLKERNSCPVCRYELPTDDEDFELRKKQKLMTNTNNNNNENSSH